MGLDYYECLGLTRNADDVAVKKAYRRLALQYHPDLDDSEAARTEFIRACEAYDVLSNPKNKGFYDLHGELGLKDGIPDGKGGTKGGFYMFDVETMPEKVFSRFFGTNNPYEALQDISSAFEVMTTKEPFKQGKRKTYEVHLTLEELFHGCLKKVTHTRKQLDESGVFRVEERELTIEVAPGTQDGTLFVFEKEGNLTPQIIPGPVVYVLKSLPHPRFNRSGAADLQMRAQVPLFHALTGGSIEVETLDSRLVRVPITEILVQSRTIVVKGEGMPKPEGGRGDLIIEADLLFPTTLSDAQKMLLKAALFLPPKLSPAATKAVWNFEVAFKDPVSGWSTACPKQAQTTG